MASPGEQVRSKLAENDQIDSSVVVDVLKHFSKRGDRVVLAKDVNCLSAFYRFEESPGSDVPVADQDGCNDGLFEW